MYLWIDISHLFVCLPTLKLTKCEQHVCSTKISYANALSLGTNSCKKKEYGNLEQRTSSKKSSVTLLRVVGQNDSIAIYIASSESCEPKIIVRCWKKVEKRYVQEQQPNQFHHYNQNMGSVNRMDQNVVKYWNRSGSGARVSLLIKLQDCQGLCFNKVADPKACNYIKKETLAGLQLYLKRDSGTCVFSCDFCKISKNTFSTEHLWWLLCIMS